MNFKLKYFKNTNDIEAHWCLQRWIDDNAMIVLERFYLKHGVRGARAFAKAEAMAFAKERYGVEVSGRAYPRCGAKCQFALCEECKCGCEGRNHGMGRRAS